MVFGLFLLLSNYCFSQTTAQTTVSAKSPDANAATVASQSTPQSTVQAAPTGEKKTVFEKNPLPAKQKITPAVFFVVNDKPVEHLKYQQHLQQQSQKK